MKSFIRRVISGFFAAAVAASLSFAVCADEAQRAMISDEEFVDYFECAIAWEKSQLSCDSLSEYFTQNGAGTSEADWFMLAEAAVGIEDDYENYVTAAKKKLEDDLDNTNENYLTEPARTSAAVKICGGEGEDLSEIDCDEAGDNEIIWLAAAQRVNGFDYSTYVEMLEIRQNSDGSFGISGGDADITAMSLIVLPQKSKQAEAAVDYLSEYYLENGEKISCETAAWIIIGLCAQNINPSQSADFTLENGVRPIDVLVSCHTQSGGFSHFSNESENAVSTYQAVTAMAALAEFGAGGGGLFDEIKADTDIFSQTNLSCEGFDDYDKAMSETLEICASNYDLFDTLLSRAKLYNASDENVCILQEKFDKSKKICDEIETLNAQILDNFYGGAKLSKLSKLHKINSRIEDFCESDRELILYSDELVKLEKTLKIRLILIMFAIILTTTLGICFIKRKIKLCKIKHN